MKPLTPSGIQPPITRMPRRPRLATRGELALYIVATLANAVLAAWWLL